ncbi:MAG: hypothetical protein HOL85_04260 [Rhodospirillaceae bacterium]|jgi:predicted DNA-binding ribbon-helix-helix protein|nr:hypothetical protein [Rhodospirillaceae bacterium]MBT6139374.1 hypothetical protein [Rhodospirillaceae bacterium]
MAVDKKSFFSSTAETFETANDTGEVDGRLVRRHYRLLDRRTSISLNPEEWEMLETVAQRENISLKALIGKIDEQRGENSVPSAVRIHLLAYWRQLADRHTPDT